jgi:hypothetical protein
VFWPSPALAQPRARGEQLLAGARNGLDHFNACDSRTGPRRVHGAITATLHAVPPTSQLTVTGLILLSRVITSSRHLSAASALAEAIAATLGRYAAGC